MLKNLTERLKEDKRTWLVTGCAGFIGSNILEFLLNSEQKVVGLDNFSTGKKENLNEIKDAVGDYWSNFRFIEGDVSQIEDCFGAIKGVDHVLHQAALGSVPRSIKDPLASHNSNVNGHLNMLHAATTEKVKSFVFASSSSVYGDNADLPKHEDIIGNQLSPYAVTKYVNELYAKVFRMHYGINTLGIRYFNVFGRRQNPDSVYAAVIPKWIKLMMNNEAISIYGDGSTSRDFCYIDNVIQMNILASLSEDKKAFGEIYNCAFSDTTSLNDLYKTLKSLIESKDSKIRVQQPNYLEFRDGDIKHSLACIDKAKEKLGYYPSHSLTEGMKETIDWYLENL